MRRFQGWIVFSFIIIVLLAVTLTWGIDLLFAPRLPALKIPPAVLKNPVTRHQVGIYQLAACYKYEREGVKACSLTGPPEVRGAVLGRFYTGNIAELETSLINSVSRALPGFVFRWAWARYVIIRNRGLRVFIPEEIQHELGGLVAATKDQYPQYGPYYSRLLNYLVMPELCNAKLKKALTRGLAFGISAQLTEQGHPIMGRSFDLVAGEKFDRHKLVMFIQPEQGYNFISVAWPGMLGVISGMNEAGLAVAVLAGHSRDRGKLGTPVYIAARRVLTRAGTLAEAAQIIREAEVFSSASFLIGSGPEDRFIVVEKTPARTAIREMKKGIALAANHFITPKLGPDQANQDYQRESASVSRLRRLAELIHKETGKLTITGAVRILRDCRGLFGRELGLGNRSVINSLTAVHAVVFDLADKIAWVSAYPHQLGAFIPFSVDDFLPLRKEKIIAADPLLTSGQYNEYLVYKHGLREAEQCLKKRKYQEALSWLLEVRPLNPNDYHTFLLAGKALQAMGRRDAAKYNFRKARQLQPVFFRERIEIEGRLHELNR
ncbi:hypothetical protein KAR10_02685 [bacterium]|nr:hypothetical protein [bacterium]